MTQSLHQAFLSHLLRYVGIGLVSGSIVHASTLGGNGYKYIAFVAVGICLFTFGTYLETRAQSTVVKILPYLVISVIVSIGTGMVSGGTQHFSDGPFAGAVLIPVGCCIAYLSFAYRDYKNSLTYKKVFVALCLSIIAYAGLHSLALYMEENPSHHESGDETAHTIHSD